MATHGGSLRSGLFERASLFVGSLRLILSTHTASQAAAGKV